MATAVGGSAITITADGGTGSADSSNTGTNHIKVEYADFAAICQVKSFTLDLSREEIDLSLIHI